MSGKRYLVLSDGATVFLEAMVEHMNQSKILPPDDAEALESSAWLEEIAAAAKNAKDWPPLVRTPEPTNHADTEEER